MPEVFIHPVDDTTSEVVMTGKFSMAGCTYDRFTVCGEFDCMFGDNVFSYTCSIC